MKKFITFLFCGFLALFLGGCAKNLLNDSVDLVANFESDVRLKENNKEYEFKILHTPEGINTITFKKPENIKGLTLSWENGKYKISMKELSGEFIAEPLTENSSIGLVVKILNSLNDRENLKYVSSQEGENLFKGKCENIDYEIKVNNQGKIMCIMIPERNITTDFSYA